MTEVITATVIPNTKQDLLTAIIQLMATMDTTARKIKKKNEKREGKPN